MKMLHTVVAHLLVLAFPICTAKALPPPPSDPEALYSNKLGKSPAEVIDHYERNEPTTSADFFTLALAYYAKADFGRALDLANRALALESDPVARSVCFVLIAECHGGLGQYDLAAEAALYGSRLRPGDKTLEKELAGLRYGFATLAKDNLAAEAAKEYLMQLDPDFQRHPTILPIAVGIFAIAVVGTYIYVLTLLPDKERGEVIAKSLPALLGFATTVAAKLL